MSVLIAVRSLLAVLGLVAACAAGCSPSSADKTPTPPAASKNHYIGRITLDIPGGGPADVYAGPNKIGTGAQIDVDVEVPEQGDLILWAQVSGREAVWMTMLSNDGRAVTPLAGVARIDARTTAGTLLLQGPGFLAPTGEQNAAVGKIIWQTPELDAVARALELTPTSLDPDSEALTGACRALATAVVIRLAAVRDGVSASATSASLVSLPIQKATPFPAGVTFATEAKISPDGSTATLQYGQVRHPLIELNALDALVAFGEVDKRRYDAKGENPFDGSIDRRWPYLSPLLETHHLRTANALELLELTDFIFDHLIEDPLFGAIESFARQSAMPSVSLTRLGTYSTRYLTGALQRDKVQSILADKPLSDLTKRALVGNIIKASVKVVSATGLLDLSDSRHRSEFLHAVADKLNAVAYYDWQYLSSAQVLTLIEDVADIALDTSKPTVERWLVDRVKAMVRRAGKLAANTIKGGPLADRLAFYAIATQLMLSHPMESELFFTGGFGDCTTDQNCFADQYCGRDGKCRFGVGPGDADASTEDPDASAGDASKDGSGIDGFADKGGSTGAGGSTGTGDSAGTGGGVGGASGAGGIGGGAAGSTSNGADAHAPDTDVADAGIAPPPWRFATRSRHTCIRMDDGTARCWGWGGVGQLGSGPIDSSIMSSATPVTVSNVDVRQVVAGDMHTCALLNNGSVSCWGQGGYGEIDGGSSSSAFAVPIAGLGDVVRIGEGGWHTCAILADRSVRCWGYDTDHVWSRSPSPVPALSDATQVIGGLYHTCARLENRSVRCWGDATYGQLGDGSAVTSATPIAVSGLTGAMQIVSGWYHTCALLDDATVKCWGWNNYGQLGNGVLPDAGPSISALPIEVSGLAGVQQIAAGGYNSCALLADRTARCWGYNYYGQLGDQTFVDSASPVTVNGLTDIVEIAVGDGHTCALLGDGSARCWGYGYYGELGNGTIYAWSGYPWGSQVPTPVIGLP